MDTIKESNTKTKKATTQKKVSKKNMSIEDIPEELLSAITKQITDQIMSSIKSEKDNTCNVEVKETYSNEKFTKAMLNKVRGDEVIVTSCIDNVVFISPKSNMKYRWAKTGDSEILTIDEILVMESESERFLHTPWLRVDDRRIIEAFNLEKIYYTIDTVNDIQKLLTLSENEIIRLFENIPYSCRNSYKQNIYDRIYMEIKTQKLTDLRIIQSLEKALNIELLSLLK